MKPTSQLKHLIKESAPVVAPGVYDGLSARLVELAGFQAVYASGGAIARSTGRPDLGLLSLSEVVDRLETIVDAVDLPVIADADTGYGNALNVRRSVRDFARAGVAGLHLEDQTFPKKCGHYDDKTLVSLQEMQQKLHAARDAASDDDFVIIARTDALAVEGESGAVERAHAYMSAGADVIFIEAPTSAEQIERLALELSYPKLINMFHGGKTPLMPVAELVELGYAIVIIPSDLQRAAIAAMRETLEVLQRDGHSGSLNERMASFREREEVVGTNRVLELDRLYSVSKKC